MMYKHHRGWFYCLALPEFKIDSVYFTHSITHSHGHGFDLLVSHTVQTSSAVWQVLTGLRWARNRLLSDQLNISALPNRNSSVEIIIMITKTIIIINIIIITTTIIITTIIKVTMVFMLIRIIQAHGYMYMYTAKILARLLLDFAFNCTLSSVEQDVICRTLISAMSFMVQYYIELYFHLYLQHQCVISRRAGCHLQITHFHNVVFCTGDKTWQRWGPVTSCKLSMNSKYQHPKSKYTHP